jgi:hypothetical protein
MKDVLIVTEECIGIMKALRKGISAYTGLTYDYLDHDAIRKSFTYRNFGHRAKNFFLKNFQGRNLKHEYYHISVKRAIESLQPFYKKILVIRPDLLDDDHLEMLRGLTDNFMAYYWDPFDYFPRNQDISHYFDRILSFDPDDCKKFDFDFLPNFYCHEQGEAEMHYQVYNLSTYDDRRWIIEQIARTLQSSGISYLFKGYSSKVFKNPYIIHTPLIPYQQMISEIKHCKVILDVGKKGQSGLTLRPFEALGLNKKLVTTNTDIKNYSFYHPDNIFILEPGRMEIDPAFFKTPYKPIPAEIKEEYHIRNWLDKVLNSPILYKNSFRKLSRPVLKGERQSDMEPIHLN